METSNLGMKRGESQQAVSQSYFGSKKAQVRKRLRQVFDLIGRGEVPGKGVIEDTEPWMISAYQQGQLDIWLQRGGRTEGLRFAPHEPLETAETRKQREEAEAEAEAEAEEDS